jgi:hypothetical protein
MQEKIREIMLSDELPNSEKIDRLHALIPGRGVQNRQVERGDARATQAIKRRSGDRQRIATDQAPNLTRRRKRGETR